MITQPARGNDECKMMNDEQGWAVKAERPSSAGSFIIHHFAFIIFSHWL
jgi:hypothetical protein